MGEPEEKREEGGVEIYHYVMQTFRPFYFQISPNNLRLSVDFFFFFFPECLWRLHKETPHLKLLLN